jgi:hypothetical protein
MQYTTLTIAFAAGVLLHATVFAKHFELDRHASSILISAFVLFAATVIAIANLENLPWDLSVISACAMSVFFLGGLLGSMTVYRLLLHPLRSFPGPKVARVSSLWVVKQNIPRLNLYVRLRSLHDHYGDFVRISKYGRQRS